MLIVPCRNRDPHKISAPASVPGRNDDRKKRHAAPTARGSLRGQPPKTARTPILPASCPARSVRPGTTTRPLKERRELA